MKRSQWSDQEIEDLFKKLPNVQDTRNPEEIYKQISGRVKRKKLAVKWIPAIAAAAALIVFTVLSSSLLQTNSSDQIASDRSSAEKAASEPPTAEKKEETKQSEPVKQESDSKEPQLKKNDNNSMMEIPAAPQEKQTETLLTAPQELTSVFPADRSNHTVLTLGIPDEQLNYFIPVSYVVNKMDEAGRLDALKQKMTDVIEQSFGLSDFYPLNVEIAAGTNPGTVNINFPDGITNAIGDNEMFFMNALSETFRYDEEISKVSFSTNGQPGAEFPHMGMLQEMDIDKAPKRAILVYQLNPQSPVLFVPSYNSYETVAAAFDEMKKITKGSPVTASVDQSINVAEFRESGEELTVIFAQNTQLEYSTSHMRSIEAILLLARDFGYKYVLFDNSNIQTIGSLDLSKKIPVPVAPNKTS
ncbi:hypothetical protein D0469_20030 [Peribacillus saganii]|uniref:Negative regulator of sigma-X activity n=1 Tax=Peribacillus saganii TaxID=2303992 RepID=A0A372LC86_9BACI|nr:hypothetical protein [Peribacillus saganii]RFU63140.1 hypothetical protein D0469_20030 [Peribacillus saganii]